MGRFETGVLTSKPNLAALADLSGKWIDAVHARRPANVAVLDMDSSVSPTHGEQEGTACNGHFGCTCYHPLFVFNQFGDLERTSLRSGNVHSAHDWRSALEPVVARYRDKTKRRFFRGDAAFALPDLYDDLEAEGCKYTIYNQRGTAEQYIKEGNNAVKWTRLSCRTKKANAVRLQLHALALPDEMESWSLTTTREKVVKIGAKVIAHARYAVFRMAEVAVPRNLFRRILDMIDDLRPREPAPC